MIAKEMANPTFSLSEKEETKNLAWLKGLLVLLPLVLVGIQWVIDVPEKGALLLEVPKVMDLPFLETEWNYMYLHLFTVIPVFLLSFDRKVHYYTRWKALMPSILVVGLIFIAWDVFFTWREVWGFNETYFLGVTLFHLPIEEWMFFLTVPFACVFIYECLNAYIRKDLLATVEPAITPVLIILCLAVGLIYWGHLYTSTTFLATGSFVAWHYFFADGSYRSRFYLSYLVSLIPFLMVNGVLTGGYTAEPVVIYNPAEYLDIRITSVPVDDSVYGFLLLFMVVTGYEKLRSKFA